ncbi:MAG: VPLPA-CTERM sorting domain-containing protein [Methylococcaceae bacterium]|nr:VPLPA-CTERM sorting domain-containing protein [Methylococcaceae bacterium]
MKKIFISLVLSLFVLPLTAQAASISIINDQTSGGGTVTNGSGVSAATANHNDIVSDFSDTWVVDVDPAGDVFSLATSNFFSDFNVEYSLDGVNFFSYNDVTEVAGQFSIKDLSLQNITGFTLRIFGTLDGRFTSGGYNVSVEGADVSSVPVPAAAWLFGSALMGLVGFSRRKSSVAA